MEKNSLNVDNFSVAPPPELFDMVMGRLDHEMRNAAVKKMIVFGVVLVGSVAASFPVWAAFWQDVTQSGFAQYAGLLFSDFSATVSYWQDFWLTLLETLPAVSLAGALTVLLTLLTSLRSVVRYSRILTHASHPQEST